ncbi:M13 family metallopeptidase [Sphingomonas astaxanthinifaciens]|uniref:Zinc metalloprotease n=1 Tax=Sphingomonas astaxanthinifaciens DSM 22298 TaxID=1123267 RepID=A0ABQ5Z5M1_9SPHN|nr:M13 family metallopeptidase [Sphingomonas astaxanthinifaciens]GLR48073.1 zinc metalloprotease [Sphingomonas astaxanthinifaciens DSM 22298]
MNRLFVTASAAFAVTAATAAWSAAPVFGSWGYDQSSMDRSVRPGDDFFAFVNGSWDKRTQIAPDRTFAGIDSVLNDKIDSDVRAIVEDLARDPQASGRIGQQVGDYYASWMDEAGIEAKGTAPLKPYLARIAAVKDRNGLVDLFTTPGYESPIGFGIYPDFKDPTRYSAYASQGGLGLPNRDYYLLQGEKYVAYRKAYRDYVVTMQQLAGIPDAAARADRIIALETAIAKIHWTPEKSRDVDASYNPKTLAQLKAFAPQIAWDRALRNMGLAKARQLIVAQPSAIAAEAKLLATVPLQTWKDWSAFHFVSGNAQYLPKAFDEAKFGFYSKTLRDVPEQRARWKRGVDLVNGALGEAVGQIYVARHYPPESDRQMGELITNIRAALQEKIETSSWMDAPTKTEALAKLAAFDPRTGHPRNYIDYSSLAVRRGDLLGNAIRADDFEWKLMLSRFPNPVDRTLWDMLPQTNNAYYDPTQNQITFPAAILQPPYFDPNADPASNYGSIGATIGHEIGHGFDDQGRKFDGKGRLRDWWTPQTAKLYTAKAQRLVQQYDSYEPLPGVHIKGELTLGENLGDLGGLEVAYAAYRRYVAQHGEPAVIDGLTGDQRFFIAYGYSWQTKQREGALRAQLLTNEHSPAKYRVNGVVRNLDAWYKAFDVKPGEKLYLAPADRVRVW